MPQEDVDCPIPSLITLFPWNWISIILSVCFQPSHLIKLTNHPVSIPTLLGLWNILRDCCWGLILILVYTAGVVAPWAICQTPQTIFNRTLFFCDYGGQNPEFKCKGDWFLLKFLKQNPFAVMMFIKIHHIPQVIASRDGIWGGGWPLVPEERGGFIAAWLFFSVPVMMQYLLFYLSLFHPERMYQEDPQ